MSRIVLSGLVQDMSGSAGSYVYSKWKGLHYIRLKAATVTNPNTLKQANVRNTLSASAKSWSSLTPEQRALWARYASNQGFPRNKEKNMGSQGLCTHKGRLFGGINAVTSTNTCLAASGNLLSLLTVPPVYKSSTPVSFTYEFHLSPLKLRIGATVSPVVPNDQIAMVWFKSTEKSAFKYIMLNSKIVTGEDEVDITQESNFVATVRVGHGNNIQEVPWETKYGSISDGPNKDKLIGYLQFRMVSQDGNIGSSSATLPVYYTLTV